MPPGIAVGVPAGVTTAGELIKSIRGQIPDPTDDPALDGVFTAAQLLLWLSDAQRLL